MYAVVVQKVYVRYLVFWWVSCKPTNWGSVACKEWGLTQNTYYTLSTFCGKQIM